MSRSSSFRESATQHTEDVMKGLAEITR